MVEIRSVAGKEVISYEGLFSVKELYKLINQIIDDKGYIPITSSTEETVEKTGKAIELDLMPFKKLTDYAKSVIKIKIRISDCKDVEITKDKKKHKLNKGKLWIEIDPYLETDYEHRWEATPYLYVIRTLFEKYIYTPFLSGFDKQVMDDTIFLKEQLKAFLNLYKLY
ncbi:MAG: hypothetical protein QW666_03470 [Candidatus Woesearchaeota archaeon]